MISSLERPNGPRPSLRQVLADFGPIYAASGFIGFVFAASGPVAIILSVGTRSGLSPAELASWVFGVFFIVITHPLIDVKSSVKSGIWQKVGSKPVQWVFALRAVTFQKRQSKLLRDRPHDWHRAHHYFHRGRGSLLV